MKVGYDCASCGTPMESTHDAQGDWIVVCPTCESGGWQKMGSAPRDGTIVLGLNRDGSTDRVYWSTDRCCILGRRAGSYSDGWMSDNVGLPVDPPRKWKAI